jgi:hypothetical protein
VGRTIWKVSETRVSDFGHDGEDMTKEELCPKTDELEPALATSEDDPRWPLVDPLDEGIRPAGPQDACLYCRRKVGQKHRFDCVVVTKKIEMRVTATLGGEIPDKDGNIHHEPVTVHTGTWALSEAYEWDAGSCEFHKNESSWCASNFLQERERGAVAWDSDGAWEAIDAHLATLWKYGWAEDEGCLCGQLEFRFSKVVDATPRRGLRTATIVG